MRVFSVDSVYSVVRNSKAFDPNTRLMDTDTLTEKIIGCAIEVHRAWPRSAGVCL